MKLTHTILDDGQTTEVLILTYDAEDDSILRFFRACIKDDRYKRSKIKLSFRHESETIQVEIPRSDPGLADRFQSDVVRWKMAESRIPDTLRSLGD